MLHIVDDDVDLRGALEWMSNSRDIPCATYSSGEQFLEAVVDAEKNGAGTKSDRSARFNFDKQGDCILLDVRMTGISGIATFDVLADQQYSRRLPVIFITGHGDVPMAVDALKRGAFDFFEKPFNDNALFDRIQEALELSRQAGEMAVVYQRLASLSMREREVLDQILLGKMNKIIADNLGISMRTVEVHRANIFDKMEVKTAVELAGILR